MWPLKLLIDPRELGVSLGEVANNLLIRFIFVNISKAFWNVYVTTSFLALFVAHGPFS